MQEPTKRVQRERERAREKELLWFCVKAFTLPVVFVPLTQTLFQDSSHTAKKGSKHMQDNQLRQQ